jgi:hypothetical protein
MHRKFRMCLRLAAVLALSVVPVAALGPPAASTGNGALAELWTCNGGSNQQWTLG